MSVVQPVIVLPFSRAFFVEMLFEDIIILPSVFFWVIFAKFQPFVVVPWDTAFSVFLLVPVVLLSFHSWADNIPVSFVRVPPVPFCVYQMPFWVIYKFSLFPSLFIAFIVLTWVLFGPFSSSILRSSSVILGPQSPCLSWSFISLRIVLTFLHTLFFFARISSLFPSFPSRSFSQPLYSPAPSPLDTPHMLIFPIISCKAFGWQALIGFPVIFVSVQFFVASSSPLPALPSLKPTLLIRIIEF